MAIGRITHHWPDDDGCTVFEMVIEPSHPDASDVARLQVMRMFREACEVEAEVEPDIQVDEP